ncbi:MAG: isoprenylcysteine carboxylmethyltransferase family protein [Calditrichaeota bacterium]|nr:isoprenylcysteine carboxylmethyltransferase family protein [Calditrichota bacterium]
MNKSAKLRIFIWIVFIVGGIVAGTATDIRLFGGYPRNFLFHALSFSAGAVLFIFVMRSSRHTGRVLAKFGREGDLPRMETNRLVKTDVYDCMRHPMHLGLLFFPLAIALLVGSLSFILFYAPLEMLIMVLMIKYIEEKEAIRKFGDEYRKYSAEVPFFNFSLNCLKKLVSAVGKSKNA